MAERDESFLARWARRKQAAREAGPQAEPQHGAPAPTRIADADAAAPPETADRAPALPDPATLDASSDFSVFLGRDVPVETQRAALRRLWRLDPIYSRIDGLDDYCEDFTDRAKVVKGLRTAYKVGRGLLEQGSEGEAAAEAATPASAAAAPSTSETMLAPPAGPSGSGDSPAPVEAGSLRPATAAKPASGPPAPIPGDLPDTSATARTGSRTADAGARHAGRRVPKRS